MYIVTCLFKIFLKQYKKELSTKLFHYNKNGSQVGDFLQIFSNFITT